MSKVSEVSYTCKVNGVVGHMLVGKKKITAMCGKIGCGTNKCHFDGECEHKQVEKSNE